MNSRTPVAYGYARASHSDQYAKKTMAGGVCDSVDGQAERTQRYWEANLKERGVLWGGVESDPFAVSAYRFPFQKRQAGIRLLNKMERGDFMVIDKIDRLWRRVADFVDLDRIFENRGVSLCIAQQMGLSIDTSQKMGKWWLQQLVQFGELESLMMSERITATMRRRKALGLRYCGDRVHGIVTRQRGPVFVLAEDHETRAISSEIIRLRDEEQMPWQDICIKFEEEHRLKIGKPFKRPKFKYQTDNSTWTYSYRSVRSRYAAEKRLRQQIADGALSVLP